jgi:hypothetical protein
MLKSLQVKNHESHVDSLFELHPGLNVIQGTSNVGKSSVLRAFELVAYNEWPGGEDKKEGKNGPVRVGCKSCTVTAENDRGTVTVNKGTGVNEWLITRDGQTNKLTSPGSGQVPEVKDLIGFEIRDIAGLKLRLNWASQRDLHFLIDQIEGQDASPSLVAAVLDELAGLSGCEELIRGLAADRQSADSKARELQQDTEGVLTELAPYATVDSEMIILKKAEGLLSEAETHEKKLTRLNEANLKITLITRLIKIASDKLKSATDIEKANVLLKRLELLIKQKNAVDASANAFSLAVKKRDASRDKLKTATDVVQADALLDQVANVLPRFSVLKERLTSLTRLTLLVNNLMKKEPREVITCDNQLARLVDLIKTLTSLSDTLSKKLTIETRTGTLKKRRDKANELETEMQKKLEVFVSSADVCPLTKKPLAESCKKALLEE